MADEAGLGARFEALLGRVALCMAKAGYGPRDVAAARADRAVCAAMLAKAPHEGARLALMALLSVHDGKAAHARGDRLACAAAMMEGQAAVHKMQLAFDANAREHRQRIRLAQTAAAKKANAKKTRVAKDNSVEARRLYTELKTNRSDLSDESIFRMIARQLRISARTVRRYIKPQKP